MFTDATASLCGYLRVVVCTTFAYISTIRNEPRFSSALPTVVRDTVSGRRVRGTYHEASFFRLLFVQIHVLARTAGVGGLSQGLAHRKLDVSPP